MHKLQTEDRERSQLQREMGSWSGICPCASNIRDHSASEQHKHAMLLLKKEQAQSKGESSAAYAPVAQAMDTLPESALKKLRIKFDIAHFVAREKLNFSKYQLLCDLAEHHG